MTRAEIESLITSSVPFTLMMADGKEYHVPHRDFITLPPGSAMYVIVFDDTDHFTILPLRTVTGFRAKVGRDGTAQPSGQ